MAKQSHISGSYLGASGAFASGTASAAAYAPTLEHLKRCLANANPDGNSYWGNEGVRVTNWIHKGEIVAERTTSTINGQVYTNNDTSLTFRTLESFEQKLAELGA
jgi:hypothetical protein